MAAKNSSGTSGSALSVRLDPRNLKGLAHPLRLRLLGSLREGGPATASMLAAKLGESSGATSYHLRQLAEFGFIVEEASRGSGRERWWRAAHMSSRFDEGSMASDPEAAAIGAEYLRSIAGAQSTRMLDWIDALPTAPEDWARAGTISDWALRLSPRQARELERDIERLIARYPRFDPEEAEVAGSAFVAVQVQLLPRLAVTER